MNQVLMDAYQKLVALLNKDKRCLGGWQFGWIARELDDEYSDIDWVFLIDGNLFEGFDRELPELFN